MTCLTEEIIRGFSRGSKNYDREAYVQSVCAKRLGDFLRGHQQLLPVGEVLEIGCGTGFVTREIGQIFSHQDLLITDICPNMLEKCRELFGSCGTFSLLDGEKMEDKERFALIVSGLAFQWFSEFEKSILNLIGALKQQGLLLFSFLESQSFPEWQLVCQETGVPYTGNPLPCINDLRETLRSLPVMTHAWEEEITLVYPSALACLKSFKQIGAGTAVSGKQLKAKEMRNLLRYWDKQCKKGVAITYTIANVAIQKR